MPLVVYFDEVGNPTLDPSDKDFPVFAITLFVCDSQCYINQIVPRVNQLKFEVFGHEGVILHSRDIRKAQGDFGFLTDPARRQPFYSALNEVMTTCDYKLIAVAIRKDRHAAQYAYPLNPYDLSLLFAMERLVSVLEGVGRPKSRSWPRRGGSERTGSSMPRFSKLWRRAQRMSTRHASDGYASH